MDEFNGEAMTIVIVIGEGVSSRDDEGNGGKNKEYYKLLIPCFVCSSSLNVYQEVFALNVYENIGYKGIVFGYYIAKLQ